MDIFRDPTICSPGKVEVDHMHDVCNIQAASRKSGGDHDRALGCFERATVQSVSKLMEITENTVSHSIFSFPLGTSSMN